MSLDLEAVSEAKILRLLPGDVIVVKCSRKLSAEQAASVIEQVKAQTGSENNVMVLPPEMDIEVLRRGA